MKAIDKKLVRDLWRMRAQVVSVALVVACGVTSYVSAVATWRTLVLSEHDYYLAARFADVFARVQRAPERVLDDLRALPGVAAVDGRVSDLVRVELPGLDEPVRGNFVSIPENGRLNALFVRSGRLPERDDEALVSEAFASFHRLLPGSTFHAIVGGRRTALRVSGVGVSPDFLWVIDPTGNPMEQGRYGIFWMRHRALATALGLEGAFTDVSLALRPGANAADVIDATDRTLAPWGSFGAYGRDLQPSSRLMGQEIGQLKGTATLLPAIFLGVAAFLVHVLLSRLVALQREQIAALKALGYGNFALARHYVLLATSMAVPGMALGAWLGEVVGERFVGMYAEHFRFPVFELRLEPDVLLVGALISGGSAFVGALAATRRALKLQPAEAMRPEAPQSFAPTVLERLGVHRLVAPAARMVLRDVERQPVRTAFSALGIACAVGILIAGYGAFDSIDVMLARQFEDSQREDVSLLFARPVKRGALRSLASLRGVRAVEAQRSVPVRLRAAAHSRETVLKVVPDGLALRRDVDHLGRRLRLPRQGIGISHPLADKLGIRLGDFVELEVLEGARPKRRVRVEALVEDFLGVALYVREAAWAPLDEGEPLVNEAMLAIDRAWFDDLKRRLAAMPLVMSVGRPEVARQTFRNEMASVFLTYQLVLVGFAAVIAVGLVYNNARIAFLTRQRELATLRILGFTREEVRRVLVGEQLAQLLLGIPVGFVLGRLVIALVLGSTDPELFRLPAAVFPRTYTTAGLLVLGAGLASALFVGRKLRSLDLVAVLKARD